MTIFLQSIINGILIGGVYALVAMGLNLMFGVMKLVNFAHGEFLMLGMYMAVGLATWWMPQGFWGIYWVTVPTMIIMALIGCLFYVLLLKRAARFGAFPQMLLTFGLSIGAQGLAQVVRGSDFVLEKNPVNGASIRAGGLTIEVGPLIGFLAAVVVAFTMGYVLRATRWGKSARAVAENVETAEMLGIDARRIFVVATAISIGLVGLTAALLVPYQYTYPNAGQTFAMVAFLSIVIAGLGNVVGSVFGGLLMGVVQSVTASYLDLDLSTAVIYVVFLAVLLLRPQGLFTRGRRVL
jgi:branched-chain amino acid transport system permease protein